MGGYYKSIMYERMSVKKRATRKKKKSKKTPRKYENEVLLVFEKKCKKLI